jgi:two-component system, OmpR family, response regulator QseB
MHLLLIEDDMDLGRALQQALRKAGLTSEWVRSALDAKRFVTSFSYDCVLLDLSLPDGNGLDLLRGWRTMALKQPVIVITARDGLDERVNGLEEGADDYLVKPFATEELIARVHAVVRRSAQQATSVWMFGDLTIDLPRRECQLSGERISLSPREFDILSVLAKSSGAVVPKHRLSQAIAPLDDPVDFNAIEVHIFNLRRKLGSEAIRTVRGIDYQLGSGAK